MTTWMLRVLAAAEEARKDSESDERWAELRDRIREPQRKAS